MINTREIEGKTMKNEITIIVRLEKDPSGAMREIIFLPDTPANYGRIAYCSPQEGHGEASLEYYWGTKKPGAEHVPELWANWYANCGGCRDSVHVVIKKRLNMDTLRNSWKGGAA